MPPNQLNEVSRAIGAIEKGISGLEKKLNDESIEAKQHRDSLRNIIDALTEATRVLAGEVGNLKRDIKDVGKDVLEMKPSVEDYERNRSEARGRAKLGRWLVALWMTISGAVVALLTWALSHWKGLGIVLLALVLATAALAQEHQHPPQDQALHERFYATWYRPNNPHMSCCSKHDCYPTVFKMQAGQWFARRREDGEWIWVPPGVLEHNRKDGIPRESPDEGSHVCMQPPSHGRVVFCAVLGIGG